MEALHTIWSFVLLFSLLAFGQLLGVLLFFVLKGRPHILAHFLSFVAPVLLSILFIWMIFIYRYYQAHPNDHDGGQLFGASMIMLLSICLQLGVGVVVQVALHSRTGVCAKK